MSVYHLNFVFNLLAKAQLTQTFESWGKKIRTKEEMRCQFSKMWIEKGYDVLIMPITPVPATIVGITDEVIPLFSVTYFANYYDLPAGVVPIRLVKEDEQTLPA